MGPESMKQAQFGTNMTRQQSVQYPDGAVLGSGRGMDVSRPMSEIDDEVNRHARLLDDMEKAICGLHDRLSALMMNSPPSDSAGVNAPIPTRNSVMANMLQDHNNRLQQCVGFIIRIQSDLAL